MVDKPWEPAAMKLMQRAEVPDCTYLFSCKKQFVYFISLSKLSDDLRTAKLPSELLTQKETYN